MSKLSEAIAFAESVNPLPRCPHDNALRDGAGEALEPPCGCHISQADRPGLSICCMRTASKYYDRNERLHSPIPRGTIIVCDNTRCGQRIEYIGGGWKNADAKH